MAVKAEEGDIFDSDQEDEETPVIKKPQWMILSATREEYLSRIV